MPEPSPLDQACEITEKLSQKPQAHDDEAEDEKSSTTGNFNASVQVQCSGAPIGQTDVYDFDSFIQRMRHPSCKPILENIKRYNLVVGVKRRALFYFCLRHHPPLLPLLITIQLFTSLFGKVKVCP